MKTVKEIALDLEVSQVTVYNHIKKLDKELKGNILKRQNTTLIDDEGIRLIKISMGLIQPPVVKEKISMNEIIENISDLVSENVSAQVKQDMEKLEEQIQELQKQNKILIEMMQEQKEKKSIFNLFKGKGN